MQKNKLNQVQPIFFFIVSSVILTWPLGLHIATSLPLGSESAATVPYFNLWTIGWNVDRLLVGFQDYWNAPIFYPNAGAFAFSDPQLLTGLISTPLWSVAPTLAYNITLLIFITLNGSAVYYFLKSQDFSIVVAFLSGFLVQALPFLTHERGVLQLQPIFGIIWAVDLMIRLLQRAQIKWSVLLGLSIAVTFLTSEYYGVFLSILLPVLLLIYLIKFGVANIPWKHIFISCSIAAFLTLPILVPQQNILNSYSFERSIKTIEKNSATFTDYLVPSEYINSANIYSPDHNGQHLFPGFLGFILGGFGIILGLKDPTKRTYTTFLLITGLIFLLLSLGINIRVGESYPYNFFRDHFPGLKNLRSPFRFGLWVQISLGLLTAITLESIWERRKFVAIFIFLLSLVEVFPINQTFSAPPPEIELKTEYSATMPAIFLPFVQGSEARDYQDTTIWMLQMLPSSMPLTNGYSGYFPSQNRLLKQQMKYFPTDEGLLALQALGVQTIFITKDWLSESRLMQLENFSEQGYLDLIFEEQEFYVYSIIK